jgi:hypothetical protein
VVGSGDVCHATRDSRMDTAPSHCSKGYPYFSVPTKFFPKRHFMNCNNSSSQWDICPNVQVIHVFFLKLRIFLKSKGSSTYFLEQIDNKVSFSS